MEPEQREQAWELFHQAYQAQMEGEFDRAAKLYQSSLEIFPTAEAHTFLGWTYHFQGRVDDAIAECKRAIAVDPDFGNPYNDIGAYLIDLGRYDEAIPWLERALEAPRYDPRLRREGKSHPRSPVFSRRSAHRARLRPRPPSR